MPRQIDPDLLSAYQALLEEKRKLGDPRRIYTRADEQYPSKQFRPDYIDPSLEEPVYKGIRGGGAEESEISPMDFASEAPSLIKNAAGKVGFPALLGAIKKSATPDLPEQMKVPSGEWLQNRYTVNGKVEPTPIEFLQNHRGNKIGRTDIEALKKSISEEGLREPLILVYDPKTQKIKLGEGNHRLEALRQLGYTHAPTRLERSSIYDRLEEILGPEYAQFKSVPFRKDLELDSVYKWPIYPAEAKPSDVIDFDLLKEMNKK